MPVMGFTKFERFFRAAGGVTVDRDDVKRYLDFVNDAIYDLLLMAQATARTRTRRPGFRRSSAVSAWPWPGPSSSLTPDQGRAQRGMGTHVQPLPATDPNAPGPAVSGLPR